MKDEKKKPEEEPKEEKQTEQKHIKTFQQVLDEFCSNCFISDV